MVVLNKIDRQVVAFDIAQLAQAILECDVLGHQAWRPGDDADMENAGRCLVGIRGRSGEADQKSHAKQPASSHSITSSARARIEGGMVRPSALAVFRLTTSSNVVGCWTGRSAGLAPLRILPT